MERRHPVAYGLFNVRHEKLYQSADPFEFCPVPGSLPDAPRRRLHAPAFDLVLRVDAAMPTHVGN